MRQATSRVYFNVQFYTKCAVLNPFVQFLKHKCAVTKLTKIALKQSSRLLITLVDAPENARNAVIEHQKYKRFLGEDPRPSYFPHKSLTCWGNGKEGFVLFLESTFYSFACCNQQGDLPIMHFLFLESTFYSFACCNQGDLPIVHLFIPGIYLPFLIASGSYR